MIELQMPGWGLVLALFTMLLIGYIRVIKRKMRHHVLRRHKIERYLDEGQ